MSGDASVVSCPTSIEGGCVGGTVETGVVAKGNVGVLDGSFGRYSKLGRVCERISGSEGVESRGAAG